MPPLFSTNARHGDSDHVFQYQPGFTSSLMNFIIVSKSKMSEWAEMEKAKADAVAETYRQTLLQEQASIDAQAANLLSLQIERGLNVQETEEERSDSKSESIAARKKALGKKQTMLELEIITLQTECENRSKRVKEIQLEESKQRARAQEAQALKERVREAKQTTVDDLTRGIINYKYLGLDFEKSEGENELRFYFTQLDEDDPMRQFSFVLQVDDEDRYELVECKPSIDVTILLDIAGMLNETDDMSEMVRRMRQSFLDIL